MQHAANEAFSRVLIDKALEFSGWNLLDSHQVRFELNTQNGRADYLLGGQRGPLCVLEAKREDVDPYDAKEQAKGYAENVKAPFIILSNGREHWFWNYTRKDQDAYTLHEGSETTEPTPPQPSRIIPTWEGVDTLVSREITIVGPDGEKVDVMTFRGGYERDIREFVANTPELKAAVEAEDDDAVETIVNEQFYHRPTMYYSPDKLILSYGVPASTPAFVYNAVGRKPLPTRDAIVTDAVDSIAARFNLRYNEQKWLDATAQLIAEDSSSLHKFIEGDMTIFNASQFNRLGGVAALSRFDARENVFEALRQSSLVRQSLLATSLGA